ncbi:hypothetical protein V2J09_023488 [Rumex salicifolius]
MEDGSRTPLLERRSSGSSFIKACFNGTNAFLGIGLLTVPYALASGGWLSLVFFFLVGIITFYTGILLKRCMDMDPSIRNYLDIAERAFGKAGRIAVMVIMNCELYLVAIGLLILEGDNLHKLFPEFMIHLGSLAINGKRTFVIITGLVILPTMLLTDLGYLSYVSATGVFSCLIILVSVICVGIFDGVGFTAKGSVLNLTGIPTAVSLYIVCFAGHPVLLFSFLITTLTYALMAVAGYLMYGDNVEDQITLDLPTNSVSGNIAIYTTLLIPLTRYALMMTPVANAIESGLSEPQKNSKFVKRAIRLGLLFSTIIFAFLFPYFESLISIVGSIFVVMASLLLPCLCYLKISESYLTWSFKSIVTGLIVVFGIIFGILGTYFNIAQLVEEM